MAQGIRGSTPTCSIEGCEKPAAGGRGWCPMHYARWKRNGDPVSVQRMRGNWSLAERLAFRTCKREECWEWTGTRNKRGAGYVRWQGKMVQVHRAAYEAHVGPIPAGYEVCHHCDNSSCLRPDHLFLGTHRQNMADMTAKGRQASKLTEPEVREIRDAYAAGGCTQEGLAQRYGVSRSAIDCIIRRRNWKHVA